jgi:type IV secretion system protein VirD4
MKNTPTNDSSAYTGELVLTSGRHASMDTWETGLNNNLLVLGGSGSGKTRNFLKPNLLECAGSYVVLDSKGRLYREMAPYLRGRGYKVDRLDFTTMEGTLGYDPLHHVRWSGGRPLGQDIVAIASALFPRDDMGQDPFWASAAANYLASYIAYVFEALPDTEWNMASVVSVFEQACDGDSVAMFAELASQDPESYAVSLWRRARTTARAEKMHASIMGIISANIFPLTFEGALASFRRPKQIDFRMLGHERRALFVTMDDMDHSLAPLTSLFVRQAFQSLCTHADAECEGGRLPVPVRFMLDDFANLTLPGIDDVLAVIRSREVSCTLICQTVSQLEARYGEPSANSIIGNCDRQLVLGFQDERTARYFSTRANRTPGSLLETPAGSWWYFERGRRGACEAAYELEAHPAFSELIAAGEEPAEELRPEDLPEPEEWYCLDFDEDDWEELPLSFSASGAGSDAA